METKVLEKPKGQKSNIDKGTKGVHKFNFKFKKRTYNEKFMEGIKSVPLRSCLLSHNAEKNNSRLFIKTEPKWFTHFNCDVVDLETGEVSEQEHISNCFKKANARKIKALKRFCDTYQPLFKQRKVSLLLHTFTRSNRAKITFRDMLKNIRYHYEKQMGLKVYGFLWALEISEGLHVHYHLCISVSRFKVSKMPKELKFESLWGQRTGVEFIRLNIKNYLAKYFAKDNYRAFEKRSYGMSRTLSVPSQSHFIQPSAN